MFPIDDGSHPEETTTSAEIVTPTAPLTHSLGLIAVSLVVGFFFIWIVRVGWVLEALAG
jgi:hypothetical protein